MRALFDQLPGVLVLPTKDHAQDIRAQAAPLATRMESRPAKEARTGGGHEREAGGHVQNRLNSLIEPLRQSSLRYAQMAKPLPGGTAGCIHPRVSKREGPGWSTL